jgi:hypothetical protein
LLAGVKSALNGVSDTIFEKFLVEFQGRCGKARITTAEVLEVLRLARQ